MNVINVNNVIRLDVARVRQQNELTKREVERLANALLTSHVVNPHFNLALHLGYDLTLSNKQAAIRFIENQMQQMDSALAEAVIGVMCDRFQQVLTRIPTHLQGGF